jgi:hypothetical protein
MNAANPTAPRIPPRIQPRLNFGSLAKLLALPTLFGGLAILYCFNPAQFGFYPRCALYESTGLLCPGCGTLRACHELLHGHVAAAFQLNALFVLSLPFFAWLGFRLIVDQLQHRPSSLVVRPFWLWLGFAVLLLFGIARNLPVHWLGSLHR